MNNQDSAPGIIHQPWDESQHDKDKYYESHDVYQAPALELFFRCGCFFLRFQILICNELSVLFPFFQLLQKVCFQTEILGNLFKYIFCFILFTSSSPRRKDQFAVPYFSSSLIVLIQVYNGDIRHHSLVCCCGLADVLYILREFCHISFTITHITPLRIILHSGLPNRST